MEDEHLDLERVKTAEQNGRESLMKKILLELEADLESVLREYDNLNYQHRRITGRDYVRPARW